MSDFVKADDRRYILLMQIVIVTVQPPKVIISDKETLQTCDVCYLKTQ